MLSYNDQDVDDWNLALPQPGQPQDYVICRPSDAISREVSNSPVSRNKFRCYCSRV
ncbi:hypothetical protein BDR07DRAFT_1414472 [Suillus spraguei]|nr:hypothetical protein BDR07DRAFT_1414472 [Suillus spraguei]